MHQMRSKVRLDTAMTNREDIAAMRRQYGEIGLVEANLPTDPITLFDTWLKDAANNEIVVEANAMVLSTVADNQPTSRTVLLKDLTQDGFTFFSNYNSRKAQQIEKNANARKALVVKKIELSRSCMTNMDMRAHICLLT